jgi:hypothetical protein
MDRCDFAQRRQPLSTALRLGALLVLTSITAQPVESRAQGVDLGRHFLNEILRQAERERRAQEERQEQLRAQREREAVQREEQKEAERRRRMAELEERRRAVEQQAQQQQDEERRKAESERARREAERQEAQRQAQQQQDDERRKADSERARREADRQESLNRVIGRTKELIEEAADFIRRNPQHPNILQFVERLAALNAAITQADPNAIERLSVRLLAELQKEPAFESARQQRDAARREFEVRELAGVTTRAEKQRQFIMWHVTQHPTASYIPVLLPLIAELESGLKSPQLRSLTTLTNRVDGAILQAQLRGQYEAFQPRQTEERQTADGPARSAHMTTKNRFLLEGELGDVVLMFNTSSQAPNVARNLRGDIIFNQDRARTCWFQEQSNAGDEYILRRSLSSYRLREVDIDRMGCRPEQLMTYDIIAAPRGAFLKQLPSRSLALLKEIELDHFKLLTTLKIEQVNEALSADEQRSQISRLIEAEVTNEYGLLLLIPTSSSLLCLATPTDVEAHKNVLLGMADRVTFEMGKSPIIQQTERDVAFLMAQRDQCGAIYGSAADLKVVSEGLKKIQRGHRVAAVRVQADQVSAKARQLQEENEADKRADAARRRQEADRRELEGLRKRDELARRDQQQQSLRKEYGKIAAAKAAAVEREIRDAIESSEPERALAYQQYPKFIHWFKDQVRDRWEVQTFKTDIQDYGVVTWKGRQLEGALVEASMRLRNRILGEYKDVCFLFGRINDQEFNMIREPVVTSCRERIEVEKWKQSFRFQSRWLLE